MQQDSEHGLGLASTNSNTDLGHGESGAEEEKERGEKREEEKERRKDTGGERGERDDPGPKSPKWFRSWGVIIIACT